MRNLYIHALPAVAALMARDARRRRAPHPEGGSIFLRQGRFAGWAIGASTRVFDAPWGQQAKVRAPCPRVLYSALRAPDPSSRARPNQCCPKNSGCGKLTSLRQSP